MHTLNLNKGAKPIEKNIIVVDEQGNEYEATYPKRAKGLVKNGRARFIGENKICLACPPDKIEMEDIKMSENNTTINTNTATNYTIDYILAKIAELQEQLTPHPTNSPCTVSSSICGAIDALAEKDGDIDCTQLAIEMSRPFCVREETYQKMLTIYERMYYDLANAEQKKMEMISKVFDPITAQIEGSDMVSTEKAHVCSIVTEQIAKFTEKILFNKTTE